MSALRHPSNNAPAFYNRPNGQSQKTRSFPDPAVSISVLVVVSPPCLTNAIIRPKYRSPRQHKRRRRAHVRAMLSHRLRAKGDVAHWALAVPLQDVRQAALAHCGVTAREAHLARCILADDAHARLVGLRRRDESVGASRSRHCLQPLQHLRQWHASRDDLGQADHHRFVPAARLRIGHSRLLPAARLCRPLEHVTAALLDGSGGQTGECHEYRHTEREGVGQHGGLTALQTATHESVT
eukprot:scaffold11598_cov73-Phaeocystis_antarctica.AAC.2